MATEKEQLLACSLANFKFPNDMMIDLGNGEVKAVENCTLKELMYSEKFLAHNKMDESNDKVQFLRSNMTSDNDICSHWKILNEFDSTSTGFYGCSVDIGNNQALMSFAGTDFTQVKDIVADLNLLTTKQTAQQKKCDQYINEFMNDPRFKKYQVGFVGHSLGGSLALHAGLVAAMIDANRIKCVTNFDGPGNSIEYLAEHKIAFERLKIAGVDVKHFQWSIVGAIFSVDSSVEFITVDMSSPPSDSSAMDLVDRHCDFYKDDILDGNSIKRGGQMGPGPLAIRAASQYLDLIVPIVEPSLLDVFFSVNSLSDGERLVYDIASVIVTTYLVLKSKDGPSVVAALAVVVLCLVIPDLVDSLAWSINNPEEAIENIGNFIHGVFDSVVKLLGMGLDFLVSIGKAISDTVIKIVKMVSNSLNYGYQYALSNSRIVVDTNLLRNYATQIQRIMNRIDDIESRLIRIYRTTISTDFFPWTSLDRSLVFNVGLISGVDDYKTRFKRTKNYLTQTAQEFEETEKKLSRSLEVSYK